MCYKVFQNRDDTLVIIMIINDYYNNNRRTCVQRIAGDLFRSQCAHIHNIVSTTSRAIWM